MAEQKPKNIQAAIENFLRNNRVWLSILTAVILLSILVVVLGTTFTNQSKDRQAEKLYALEKAYADWLDAFDADAPNPDDIIDLFQQETFPPTSYAYYRQQFLIANVYEDSGLYSDSISYYRTASQAKGYFGDVAQLKTGLMQEAAGDVTSAIDTLTSLVQESEGPQEPRIRFTLGRLAESNNDGAQALVWYSSVVEDYNSSSWATFAQNRIIALEVGE